MAKNLLFVAFPQMCLLDLSGPQTVFWAASKEMEARGLGGYRSSTVSLSGGLVCTAEGVSIDTRPFRDFDTEPLDTIVIPGSYRIDQVISGSQEMLNWLKSAAQRARRTASVCTGAFFLAETGLLNHKRAATHWLNCDAFQTRFPDIQVDRDSLYVRDGSIWTSAGVTAGIDMSLALVEEDGGREVAMAVARELVVFLKRPGGQSQFSQLLRVQSEATELFDELHYWLIENLANVDLTVEMMAEHVFMSPRNFARVYKSRTGRSPGKALELLRVEAARRMLEDSGLSINDTARRCGFGDEQRMRAAFVRNISVTPRDYRKRFSSTLV